MRDLTEGHEGKLIFTFTIPMLIGNVFQQMYHVVDSIIVGQYLGKEALAAVGASFPIIFALYSMVIGIATGGTVVISQYFGAKETDKIKRAIDTLYIFIFIASIILTTVGIIFSEHIFRLMQLPENLIPNATDFLNIFLLGTIAAFGFNGTSAILRGLGDSKTPLNFLIVCTIINVFLELLFILVFKWGIKGAALATVLAQSISFIATIVYLNKTHKILQFSITKFVFDKEIFLKSLKIGLPTGLQQTFVAFGMLALMGLVNKFGTNVIAAYTLASRFDTFASMPAMNFAMALSAFVGQNIGAQKYHRVSAGLKATLKMSAITSVSITLVTFFFGDYLMRLFTPDVTIIATGHNYLRIVGAFYLAFSSMFVLGGVMRGAGDTFIPMLVTLFSLWGVRIPLAYFLSAKYGEIGIWWSIPIAWCIGTAFSYFYYKTGRWRKKAVIIRAFQTQNIS
jgi:putative MATE family efflux protein